MSYGPGIEDFVQDSIAARLALLNGFTEHAPSPAREFLQGCAQALGWLGRESLDPITGSHALAGRRQVQAVLDRAAEDVGDPRCAGVLAALILSCESVLDDRRVVS